MTTLKVSVPDKLQRFVQSRVAEGSFRSLDEYVCDLIKQDFQLSNKRAIERELQRGLDSGPCTPMTAADWKAMREAIQVFAKSRPATARPRKGTTEVTRRATANNARRGK